MVGWCLSALGAVLCGAASAAGIGGGTLLLLYMTQWMGVAQWTAQAINLFYFIPTALVAGWHHWRGGLVDRQTLLWCGVAGIPAAIVGSYLAAVASPAQLRTGFSLLLTTIGLWQVITVCRHWKEKKK